MASQPNAIPVLGRMQPYKLTAEALPASLDEAIAALRTNACFRAGFGDGFVNYYAHLKHAEIARYRKETANEPEPGEVTAWEHREYFDSL